MKIADHEAVEQPGYDRAAFCTTRQAAARIGVSHRTVQMWVENGTLRAWKTAGGHRRIANDSVECLLEGRRNALAGHGAAAGAGSASSAALRAAVVAAAAAAFSSAAIAAVPEAATPVASIVATTLAPAVEAPRSVLIVDDDPMLLRLYELEISTWDMNIAVRKASNGIEALAQVGHARPDVLLSDLHMPGLDGFGMIRALRGDPATATLPLVVISGLDQPTVLSMGLPADVTFFTKPAPLAALRAAVTSALPKAA
ncbi:response regulator [Massilia sp. YIM B02443]|uniref:response regulator n=1 Tax=Massilia sp. YIM B02443 TaxID=3050127 RepID=UPI0025B6AF75|nr:response regulator [Massilia sp. YIM B02443]MDN4037730.1 response regulator [Massilia sp. YIM B02443]